MSTEKLNTGFMKENEDLARQRDNWRETAERSMRDVAYYQAKIDEMALVLGDEVFIQDDGGRVPEPLRAKVPELVIKQANQLTTAKSRVAELEKALKEIYDGGPTTSISLKELLIHAKLTAHNALAKLHTPPTEKGRE